MNYFEKVQAWTILKKSTEFYNFEKVQAWTI